MLLLPYVNVETNRNELENTTEPDGGRLDLSKMHSQAQFLIILPLKKDEKWVDIKKGINIWMWAAAQMLQKKRKQQKRRGIKRKEEQ